MNPRQSRFHLQVVTQTITPTASVARMLVDVLDAGADTVQLRDDQGTPAQGLALVGSISRDLPGAVDRMVVHGRLFDAAMPRGVMRHLPSASAGASAGSLTRDRTADGPPFGVSVHSLDEARWASDLGAAYLTFGHVFSTSTHPGVPGRGVTPLSRILADVAVPVLAIGGIGPDTLDEVLATGCSGIAVRSAVLRRPDPVAATWQLRALLDTSPFQPCRPLARTHMTQGGP